MEQLRMTSWKTHLLRILGLAALALTPGRFAAADSLFLGLTGSNVAGGSVTLTAGQSVSLTEYFVNTGANSTALNSDLNQGDIQISSFGTGIIWDNGQNNLKESGFALSTNNPPDDLGNSWSTTFAGPTTNNPNDGTFHVVASTAGDYDALKNQIVSMFSFTMTAQAGAAPGTYNVDLVNPVGPTPTNIADVNGRTLVLSPTIATSNTFNPAYDFQITIAGTAVPEPASIGMLSIAGLGLFLNRRKLRKLVG
jgi:hypothetical protein